MPVFLIPIAIFLSGLLATAMVRILAGAGVAYIVITGAKALLESILLKFDLTGYPAWAIEHASRFGIFEAMEIEIGAIFFALTIVQLNVFRKVFPS